MSKIYLYLFSLLVFSIFPMKAQESHDFFDPMDVFELEWASDPQVSPDSETIVYVRKSHDIMKDKVRSNIWQLKIYQSLALQEIYHTLLFLESYRSYLSKLQIR